MDCTTTRPSASHEGAPKVACEDLDLAKRRDNLRVKESTNNALEHNAQNNTLGKLESAEVLGGGDSNKR